jgi:serine/threonine protein kinase
VASTAEELERLAALLEKGLLTREQFDQQRDLLLATTSGPPPSGPPPASDPSIPAQVGAYRILSPIGQGGMGAVYKGRHRSDTIADRQGGDVAIKVMHAQFARNPEFQARFEREASLGLKLDHPGIVKVHDLVMDAGTLALVMEFVEGRSLADLIGKEVGPIPWPRAWPMFEQLLDAGEYAHSQGVIHRDLKPDNVMVTPEGKLKVLDFGIAKEAGSAGMTATGSGMGTVDYMAPEQHTDAKSVDERTDVYALGMTLYEMLAGRLPWGDEVDAVGVLHRKLSGQIPPPTDFYPDIPPEVVEAMIGALAADRQGRTKGLPAFWGDLVVGVVDQARQAEAVGLSGSPLSPVPGHERGADQVSDVRGPSSGLRPARAEEAPVKPTSLLPAALTLLMILAGVVWWCGPEDGLAPSHEPETETPAAADVVSSTSVGEEPAPEPTSPPSSDVNEPARQGWVEMKDVEKAIYRGNRKLHYCYTQALVADSTLQGLMWLTLTLGTDGRIRGAVLEPRSSLNSEPLRACLERYLYSLDMPIPEGGPVTFSYPFEFQPTR